jgi:predicted transglutaminase-like cysteine proteinase
MVQGTTYRRRPGVLLLGAAVLLGLGGCSTTGLKGSPDLPPALGRLADGTIGAPRGWIDWCARSPDDCAADEAVVVASQQNRATIMATVAHVRARVMPTPEPVGTDIWRLPADGSGDCEDFALQLRRELVRAGLPHGALKIAVAREPDGQLHAVLTIATDGPTLVLDPMRRVEPLDWRETGLTFLALEETLPAGSWSRVGMPQSRPSGTLATAGFAKPPGPGS